MIFIETSIFTRLIQNLLTDDEYARLQRMLADNPHCGVLIPGAGGLRKIRWKQEGHGKRGGIRAIYYRDAGDRIYMLYAYAKSKQVDLTPQQTKALSALVKEHLK